MNDWIVANITNPDFTISDFLNIADMSIDNTLMLSKDEYLKSDFIKNNPLFLKEDGKFSEDKFNTFYNSKLNEFLEFQTNNIPETLELSMFDTDRTADTKIRDNQITIGRQTNPDRQKVGIEGVNIWSTPEKSKSELAQASKVWDTEKLEYRDYSPNDKALFNGKKDYGFSFINSLFEEPLVLAQWDEDGTHIDPITKREVKHKKGLYRLNDEGTYFYETLNGRSPIGKQVLSSLDTITIDGTAINKYDFWDSDDIEKSISGVVAKNVATLLPMFLGGPIGTAYSTALIAKEMSKSLPMLYNIVTGFSNDEAPKWMNSIAAMGEKFSGGTSDYAKEHAFSFENFGAMISDVALQWGQQKTIASAFNKLKGDANKYMDDAVKNAFNLYVEKLPTMGALAASDPKDWMNSALGKACLKKFMPAAEKATKNATQLGRDASLAYMAIISNSDVFNDAVYHGATRSEAAAIALGSTLGMFAFDRAGFGEMFFDDATEDSVKAVRQALKKEIFGSKDDKGVVTEGLIKTFEGIKNSNKTPTNKYLGYINKAALAGKRVVSNFYEDMKYHTTGFVQKSVGEGLEEVGEELISDTFKAIYELAGKFGFDTASKDIGAWDNALERYSLSFAGGAVGGAVFYGKELWDGKSFKRDKSNDELTTLIRNGHVDDIRSELKKLKDNKKLGSTKLSTNYELNDKNEPVWLTAKDEKDSLNEAIYNIINDKITVIDAVLNNNLVNLSDEDLFKQMVLSERRYEKYKDIAQITNYYQDFSNIVSDLIAKELDLKKAIKTVDGTVNGELIPNDSYLGKLTPEELQTRSLNILQLLLKVEELRNKKNDFLSGNSSLEYTRKLNFAIDPKLHKPFMTIDEEQVWKDTFGDKTIDEISEEELRKYELITLPEAYKVTKENLTKSWNRFKEIEKQIVPDLLKISELAPNFKSWYEKYSKEMSKGFAPIDYVNWDTKLDDESDEDFKNKDSKIINDETGEIETNEELGIRQYDRQQRIDKINLEKSLLFVDQLMERLLEVNYLLDPISMDFIKHQLFPQRIKAVMLDKLRYLPVLQNIKDLLSQLHTNLDNIDEITEKINKVNKSKNFNIFKNLLDNTLNSSKTVTIIQEDPKNPGEMLSEETNLLEFIKEVFNDPEELHTLDPEVTIGEVLQLAINNNFNNTLSPESQEKLILDLEGLILYVGKDASINTLYEFGTSFKAELLDDNDIKNELVKSIFKNINKHILDNEGSLNNFVQSYINRILSDPINQLNEKLELTISNPIIELIKSMAGKTLDGKVIPDVEEILSIVDLKYDNIDNISQLVLDSTKIETLINTRDLLELIETYLYASSSDANMMNPVGHNKVINEFARNHLDLVENWEELPEIDSDYASIYNQLLKLYLNRINYWIDLSNHNNVNKRRKFEFTDLAFSQSLYDTLIDRLNNNSFKVNIDDKLYDLLEGISSVDSSHSNTPKVGISLFESEKLLYNNFLKALKDSGLSITEFLDKSNILDQLVNLASQDKNIEERTENKPWAIGKLKVSKLDETIKKNKLTKYDLVLYFALTLTLNPSDFYIQLKSRVNTDEKTAPITVQEYASKIAIASMNQQFRDIIAYAHKKSGDTKYLAANTTVLPGVAGAGKTAVLGKAIIDYLGKDATVFAVGPTITQSTSLKKSLNIKESYTINELLKKILGEKVFEEILADINKLSYNKKFENLSEKYFNIVENDDGFAEVTLKEDAPLVFNTLDNIPKAIIIDEATHLNTVFAEILDTYMKSVNGQLFLLGDPNLLGYINLKNAIGNILETDLFTIRTPKLEISLRDNNIQKQENLDNVKSLLDEVIDKYENLPESELKEYWPIAQTLISKLRFNAYNKEDIYGDLIVNSLDKGILSKINKLDKTVGFIGDESSDTYKKLKESGIKNLTALSLDTMQGLEFDYVVIDEHFEKPDADIDTKNFLLKLYTLMSRSKLATIFISNGLSSIIGTTNYLNYTAQAPSLNDKINGTSAVDDLRKLKLEILNQYNLDAPSENIPEGLKNNEESSNLKDSDFINVDDTNIDKKAVEVIKKVAEEGESDDEHTDSYEYASIGDFDIPSWGDVTYMGVTSGNNETRVTKSGKHYTTNRWNIEVPEKGELRNLQALHSEGDSAFWYSEKKSWLDELYAVKSALIFNHDWDETTGYNNVSILPKSILLNFKKSDWVNGTYEIEIRSAENEVQPMFAPMPEIGFEYNGKRYIADIVYKVKNKKGRTCVFDLAGINNPNTLNDNIEKIKKNLAKRLANDKLTDVDRLKFTDALNNIDGSVLRYSNLFKNWIDEFDKKGKFSLDVSDAINHNNITWFTKRPGKDIRLGGRIDPDDIKNDKDYNNLKDRNPGMIFSDVYTYASKNNDITEIDLSLLGKAVVFVSSDTLLNPDELLSRYVNLKKDPDHYKPTVRMIVLNNYGLRFSDFIDPNYIGTFLESEKEERKPFRQNFTGIQMFTAMWNFRAALKNFNDALTTWKADNSYDDDKLNTILKSAQYLYELNPEKVAREAYLKAQNITEDDLNNLNKFNLEICKDIPSIRLGYNEKNGFQIRSYDFKDSSIYSNGKHNLIALTPGRSFQFYELLNNVMSTLVPNKNNINSLNLSILKADKTPFEENEYIDLKDAKHRRTLSHVLKLDNKQLVIRQGSQSLAFPEGLFWSWIPYYLHKVVSTVAYYQYNPEKLSSSGLENATLKITIEDAEGSKVSHTFKNQIGHLFLSDSGKKPLLKTRLTSDSEGNPDSSMVEMFDLIFNGTVDDIHKKYSKDNPLMIADDAVFKKGFFINPDISRKKNSAKSSDIESEEIEGIKFYKISTSDELFTSDVDLRSSGVGLSLNKMEDSWHKYLNPDFEKKLEGVKYKIGDVIEIYTSDGLKLDDSIYRIFKITDNGRETVYNLEKISDKSRLTISTKDVDTNSKKYKVITPKKEVKKNIDNLIITDKYQEIPQTFTGLTTGTTYINPLFVLGGGRNVVMIDIKGMKVPFYCSTGKGGKKNVKTGKWYPIFGVDPETGWLNKTTEDAINDYYGIPLLKEIAEKLDIKYGDVTSIDTQSEDIINPIFTLEWHNKGQLDYVFKILNESFTPTTNGPGALLHINNNIEKLKQHINNSFKESFEIQFPVTYSLIEKLKKEDGKIFTEKDLPELLKYVNNRNSNQAIDILINYKDRALLEPSGIYQYNEGEDFKELTIEEYIQSLIPDGSKIESLDIKNRNIEVKTNTGTYIFNKTTNSFETDHVELAQNVLKENINISEFEELSKLSFSERTLKTNILSVLKTILNDENVQKDILKEAEEAGEDDGLKIIQDFITLVDQVSNLTGEEFETNLSNIERNERFDILTMYLEDNYEKIYKRIFKDCR